MPPGCLTHAMTTPRTDPLDSRRAAIRFDRRGDPVSALACAWDAFDAAPEDPMARAFLIRLLHRDPEHSDPARTAQLHAMLLDPDLDPLLLSPPGWAALRNGGRLPGPDAAPAAIADWLEAEPFARDLLSQAYVVGLEIEALFTRLRRWLLIENRAEAYPLSLAALTAQAEHNGGAWLFDAEERARLDADPAAPIAATYRPPHWQAAAQPHTSPVIQAVTDQYTSWPYPEWRRLMTPPGETLVNFCRSFSADAHIPDDAEILVAGCGTGREALRLSRWAPNARITAIDLSATSLAYAAQRCAAGGATNIRFEERDLHTVAELGKTFDFISCRGVLMALPDPEAGWRALTGVLKPGGIQRFTVYSQIARLKVFAARTRLGDLLDRPLTDDLLREARVRVLEGPPTLLTQSPAFFYLGGVHDLLVHRQEIPFTVARVREDVESQNLDFLGFRFHSPADAARYRRENPHDPHRRDFAAWAAFERRNFHAFVQMYDFAVRKPQ